MNTNDTNGRSNKLIYPELSYLVTGICFAVHNHLGRFSREYRYCDAIKQRLKEASIPYERERRIGQSGNQLDFWFDGKLVLEVKAKRLITKEDFCQPQRYLQSTRKKLGLLVNFRNRYLKPIRIIRIDTDARTKFV